MAEAAPGGGTRLPPVTATVILAYLGTLVALEWKESVKWEKDVIRSLGTVHRVVDSGVK